MKKSSLFAVLALFAFILIALSATKAHAEDTVVVGQPYYGGGYGGYYGGGYYGGGYVGGGYGRGYGRGYLPGAGYYGNSSNPVLQNDRLVAGSPYFLGPVAAQYGAVSHHQVNNALRTTSQILYAPNAVNPNENPNEEYSGPLYNYHDGNYY